MVVMGLACGSGCGLRPHTFRKINHPAPLMRARAVGLSEMEPDATAIPVLVGRLNDTDPVVRLAANEELKKRTRHDFGFRPWADPEERSAAASRWRAWMTGKPDAVQAAEVSRTTAPPRKSMPRPSPQGGSPP
ncbi:HEAT repeat domain-containing protein [Aquisphaera insulae]|uniref:HEAT repeat domain-containing protein n=1 Tax=Aquisphaera insulae TaxID=2712864 RepID=UPI0013EB0DCA|nr:HEAT repeat domain-containing protein [Aquisphaera insulae]